jgi:hypothetical protein
MPRQKNQVLACGRTDDLVKASQLFYVKTPKNQATEAEISEILAIIRDDLESGAKRKTVRSNIGAWLFARDERGFSFALFTKDYPTQIAEHFIEQMNQYYKEFWGDDNEKRLKLSAVMLMKKYADIKKIYKQLDHTQKHSYLSREIKGMMEAIGDSGSTMNESQSIDFKNLEEKFNRITKPRPPSNRKCRVIKYTLVVLLIGVAVLLTMKLAFHYF